MAVANISLCQEDGRQAGHIGVLTPSVAGAAAHAPGVPVLGSGGSWAEMRGVSGRHGALAAPVGGKDPRGAMEGVREEASGTAHPGG